jgi:nitrous oxidase accessory protein NosD
MRYMNPVFVALIPLAMGTATGAMAETASLTCRPGTSITAALAKLKPGDVLQVRGVCTENVVIPAHVSDITLQGMNGAIVQAADPTQPVISIRGRGISVSGLTVTGGTDGVLAASGSYVWLDGNTPQRSSRAALPWDYGRYGAMFFIARDTYSSFSPTGAT